MLKACQRCSKNMVKPTFLYFCRRCYKKLFSKYSITANDIYEYFKCSFEFVPKKKEISRYKITCKTMYNYFALNYGCSKRFAEFLEMILYLKVHKTNYYMLSNNVLILSMFF